jgi:hypothetical protein
VIVAHHTARHDLPSQTDLAGNSKDRIEAACDGIGAVCKTDSPLEGTGFEPLVPRDTTNLSMSPLVGALPTEKLE